MGSLKPMDDLFAIVFPVGLEKFFGSRLGIVLQSLQSFLGIGLGQFEAAAEGDGFVPLTVGLEIKGFHIPVENTICESFANLIFFSEQCWVVVSEFPG